MYSNYQSSSGSISSSTSASTHYDENAAMGILKHLNKQELQQLLDDDNKLSSLINDLQQVKGIQLEKETSLASNKSLADYNLSREHKFKQAKQQLARTYEQAIEIQKKFDEHKQKLQYTTEQHNLDTTLALLQTEAAKAEEDSEEVADSFLDGNIEIEEFIDRFTEKRKLAHLRKVKAEKMQEILRNRHRGPARPAPPVPAAAASPMNSWGTPPVSNHWGGSNVPYPTKPIYGMPDPSAYLPR